MLKDTAIYGGADFIAKLVAFVTFPLVAMALSPEGFGALELVLTITSLLGVFANVGTNNSIQRFYWDSDTPQGQRPLLVSTGATMLLAFQCGAVFFGVVAFAVCSALGVVDHVYVGWVGALAALFMMAASQLSQYMLDVIRLHRAPWRFFGVSIVLRVATALAGVVAVAVLGFGLDVMLAMQALVAIAAVPLATVAVSRDIVARFDWTFARLVFNYGHPFIYAGMAFWLLSSIDRWMLASLSSVSEVGIYSAAFRYASIALFLSTAFGQAWSPMAMKLRVDHPETYREIYSDILLALSAGMLIICSGVALFSADLIALTMTPDFAATGAPLAVLSLGVALQATVQITAVGISIERKTYLFARLSWLTAVVNIAINLVLIPTWGALGAAWGTAIAYLFLTCSYLFFTQRLHPLPLKLGRLSILGLTWVAVIAIAGSGALASADLAWLPVKFGVLAVCALASAAVLPWTGLRTVST